MRLHKCMFGVFNPKGKGDKVAVSTSPSFLFRWFFWTFKLELNDWRAYWSYETGVKQGW